MGYRSNVFFAISGPKSDLDAFLVAAQLLPEYMPVFTEFKSQRGTCGGDDVFAIQGEWKHYDSYEDVRALNALWEHAKQSEDKLDGAYIIIGEDFDDVNRYYFGTGYQLADVSRSIDVQVLFPPTVTAS